MATFLAFTLSRYVIACGESLAWNAIPISQMYYFIFLLKRKKRTFILSDSVHSFQCPQFRAARQNPYSLILYLIIWADGCWQSECNKNHQRASAKKRMYITVALDFCPQKRLLIHWTDRWCGRALTPPSSVATVWDSCVVLQLRVHPCPELALNYIPIPIPFSMVPKLARIRENTESQLQPVTTRS